LVWNFALIKFAFFLCVEGSFFWIPPDDLNHRCKKRSRKKLKNVKKRKKRDKN